MKNDSFDLSSLDPSAPLDGSSFVAEDFVDEDVETLDNTSEIPESDDERAERLAREERARVIDQEAARLDAQFAAEQAERDRLAADKVQQAMKKMRRKRAVLAMVGLIIVALVTFVLYFMYAGDSWIGVVVLSLASVVLVAALVSAVYCFRRVSKGYGVAFLHLAAVVLGMMAHCVIFIYFYFIIAYSWDLSFAVMSSLIGLFVLSVIFSASWFKLRRFAYRAATISLTVLFAGLGLVAYMEAWSFLYVGFFVVAAGALVCLVDAARYGTVYAAIGSGLLGVGSAFVGMIGLLFDIFDATIFPAWVAVLVLGLTLSLSVVFFVLSFLYRRGKLNKRTRVALGIVGGTLVVAAIATLLGVFGSRLAWWQWQHIIGALGGAILFGGFFLWGRAVDMSYAPGIIACGILVIPNGFLGWFVAQNYAIICYWMCGYMLVGLIACIIAAFKNEFGELGGVGILVSVFVAIQLILCALGKYKGISIATFVFITLVGVAGIVVLCMLCAKLIKRMKDKTLSPRTKTCLGIVGGTLAVAATATLLGVFGSRLAWWQWQHIIGALGGAILFGGFFLWGRAVDMSYAPGIIACGILVIPNGFLGWFVAQNYAVICYWMCGYMLVGLIACIIAAFKDGFEEFGAAGIAIAVFVAIQLILCGLGIYIGIAMAAIVMIALAIVVGIFAFGAACG